MQYDPRGGENRHLYYHYLDKRKRDKFVRRIFRAETNNVTFRISADYKYLILRDSRSLSIANIESLDDRIIFRDIFIMSPGLTYVSIIENYLHSCCLQLKIHQFSAVTARAERQIFF